MDDYRKNLMAALIKAQMAVSGVEKNARNDFAGYDYVSADGMVRQLRQSLLSAGLAFFRSGWRLDGAKVISEYMLIHPDSGEHKVIISEMPVFEAKGRPLDKAVLGALTTSLSYVLRDLLLVPRVDELEIDNRPSDEPAYTSTPVPKKTPSSSLIQQVEKIADQSPQGAADYIAAVCKRASTLHSRDITSLAEMPENLLAKIIEAHKGA